MNRFIEPIQSRHDSAVINVKKPSKIIFNKQQSNVSSSSNNKRVKQNKNLLLNKSKSEIFAKKINKQHSSRIEQQVEENSILRRRNVLNYSMPRLLHAQLSISNSKSCQNNNLQLDSSLPTTAATTATLQSETNSKYFNSKFFLPSDKSSTTGSTTSDDEIEEEIETYKFSSEKKQPQQSDIDDVEEYDYDLNEGDLSDSDQTESCILNDANNNDILDEDKSNEFIENNNNNNDHLIDSNDENNNNLKFNNTKKYRSNSIGLSAVKEKISCIIWHNNEWKGVDLSMLEISNCIIMNVKKASLSVDYFYVGIIFSILIGLMPIYYQNNERIFILSSSSNNNETIGESQQSLFNYMPFNMLCLSSVIETINFWINIEPK